MVNTLFLIWFTVIISAQAADDEAIDLSSFGRKLYGKPIQHEARSYDGKYGNPEERGPYLEGDLLVVTSKNGIKTEASRWKNSEIPYEIRSGFSEILILTLTIF